MLFRSFTKRPRILFRKDSFRKIAKKVDLRIGGHENIKRIKDFTWHFTTGSTQQQQQQHVNKVKAKVNKFYDFIFAPNSFIFAFIVLWYPYQKQSDFFTRILVNSSILFAETDDWAKHPIRKLFRPKVKCKFVCIITFHLCRVASKHS